MSMTLSHLPIPLVESFKDPLEKTDDLASIRRNVKVNRTKIPNLDTTVIDGNVTRTKIASVNSPQTNSVSPSRYNSPSRYSPRQCQYCMKTNHRADFCFKNPHYCYFHKSSTHGAIECNALRYKHSQQNTHFARKSRSPTRNYGRNSRSPNPHFSSNRNRYSSQSRNRYNSQSRQPFNRRQSPHSNTNNHYFPHKHTPIPNT